MRIKLILATILFLLPSYICGSGSKENKNSIIETSELALNAVEKREDAELTDDYADYPLCGDKPMNYFNFNCYCGNKTLYGYADLRDGDYYCCVPPSVSGKDQCKYTDNPGPSYRSDVRCNKPKRL